MISPKLASVALLSAALSACAFAPKVQETQTGFLSNYDQLQPVNGDKNVLRHTSADFDPANYSKIIFEPVEVKLSGKLQTDSSLSIEEQKELAAYFSKRMQEILGNELITGKSGPTLHLHGAFTGITNASEDLKIWQYVPIALVLNMGKEVAGKRDKVPVLFLEFKAIDGKTGESVLQAMRKLEMAEISAADLKSQGIEVIKPKIDAALTKLRDVLAEKTKSL